MKPSNSCCIKRQAPAPVLEPPAPGKGVWEKAPGKWTESSRSTLAWKVLENVFEIEMDMGDRKQWTKNLDEPVLDLGKHLKKTWGNPGYQFSGFKKKTWKNFMKFEVWNWCVHPFVHLWCYGCSYVLIKMLHGNDLANSLEIWPGGSLCNRLVQCTWWSSDFLHFGIR